MAAKSKPVEELKVADLGIDAGQVGAPAPARRSSPSRTPRPARPARSSRTTARRFDRIVAFLDDLKVI